MTLEECLKLEADLAQVFARHGMHLLKDDGLALMRDSYSDAYLCYFRPASYKLPAWKLEYQANITPIPQEDE